MTSTTTASVMNWKSWAVDPTNPGYNPEANVDDGSCLTGGCTIAFACNYDPTAEFRSQVAVNSLLAQDVLSEGACNYDPDATLNNGSCDSQITDTIVTATA